MVEIRLTFCWFEVDNLIFGWSLLHFQLISQPNINVENAWEVDLAVSTGL